MPQKSQTRKKPRTEKDFYINEGDTIYSLNLIPLGGFVKIKGEEGENQDPDSFMSKSFWQKTITLVAGVGMNVVLAAVLFS